MCVCVCEAYAASHPTSICVQVRGDDGEPVSSCIIFLLAPHHEVAIGDARFSCEEKRKKKNKKKKNKQLRTKTALLGRTALPHKNMFDHHRNFEELGQGQTFVMLGI